MSIQAIFQAIKQNDLSALKLLLQANPNMLHESNNNYFQYTHLLHAHISAHQRAKLDYLLKLDATFAHEVFELIYRSDQAVLSV